MDRQGQHGHSHASDQREQDNRACEGAAAEPVNKGHGEGRNVRAVDGHDVRDDVFSWGFLPDATSNIKSPAGPSSPLRRSSEA